MQKNTSELKSHPLNESIYGDVADEKLIQSIQNQGILEPLIIDHQSRIVSGHRRWDAAVKLGLPEVPVEVFRSEDELDIEAALVEANRQRIKSNEQVARETAHIFKVEQQKAVRRQKESHANTQGPANSTEGGGDARDLAGKKVGMGGKKVEQSVRVVETIDRLTQNGEAEKAKQIQNELNRFSVNRAHKVATEMGVLKGVPAPEAAKDKFILISDWNQMGEVDRAKALAANKSKSKFVEQESDGIEWAQWSWNPITGCKHDCDYCYARDIAVRMFKPKFEPAFYPGRLSCPGNTVVPAGAKADPALKNVFTCSMADLFGKWVPPELIKIVLGVVQESPEWNFLFLTKNPRRLLEFDFPDNAWVGTTVDRQDRVAMAEEVFKDVRAKIKWLSCEPMMEKLTFQHLDRFQWVVIGGASSSTRTPEFHPPREWVTELWNQAEAAGAMIYEKPNLLERRREFPNAA